VLTELQPPRAFHKAEWYHQRFWLKNKCVLVWGRREVEGGYIG
jgi:peptide methionine sulfoxide reductase MsrA